MCWLHQRGVARIRLHAYATAASMSGPSLAIRPSIALIRGSAIVAQLSGTGLAAVGLCSAPTKAMRPPVVARDDAARRHEIDAERRPTRHIGAVALRPSAQPLLARVGVLGDAGAVSSAAAAATVAAEGAAARSVSDCTSSNTIDGGGGAAPTGPGGGFRSHRCGRFRHLRRRPPDCLRRFDDRRRGRLRRGLTAAASAAAASAAAASAAAASAAAASTAAASAAACAVRAEMTDDGFQVGEHKRARLGAAAAATAAPPAAPPTCAIYSRSARTSAGPTMWEAA